MFSQPCYRLFLLTAWALPAIPLMLHSQEQLAKPLTPPSPVELRAADFPNLQAAFDALPESGGIVQLPPGTVEIREPLIISTPETRITGSGASTHIKNLNEEGKPAIRIRPKDYEQNKRSRLWRIQLDNFRISGNESSGDGILAEGINEIFLQGLSIDHHGGHGIALIYCVEDPRVADSILTYNKKAGLYVEGCHDIVVNANHFEENQDAVVCTDSFNLTMNGNNIDDHLRHGVVIENTYGSVLSGNMIEECDGTAIVLDRDAYGITLSANVIAHDMGGGIDLQDAHGITVSANTFVLLHHFGVRVSEKASRITISANNFCNSYLGEGQHRRPAEDQNNNPVKIDIGHGVVLESTKHVIISGNQFSGLDGPAVRSTGSCEQILINSNIATDLNRRTEKPKVPFNLSTETKAVVSENISD